MERTWQGYGSTSLKQVLIWKGISAAIQNRPSLLSTAEEGTDVSL